MCRPSPSGHGVCFPVGAEAAGPCESESRLALVPGTIHAATAARTTTRLDVLPTRNPKIIFKALATGAVLYSPQDEVYFGLNPVGVRVWELLPPATSISTRSAARW